MLSAGPTEVVTGSSGRRAQRRIHGVDAEGVPGAPVRDDDLDAATAGPQLVDLRGQLHTPLDGVARPAAEGGQHEHPFVSGSEGRKLPVRLEKLQI